MKNIKLVTLFIFALCLSQVTYGQDNNGRPAGARPGAVEKNTTRNSESQSNTLVNGHDFDVAPPMREAQEDLVFPQDFKNIQDELLNSTDRLELINAMNEMRRQMNALVSAYEDLKQENRVIRESLGNCCSDAELGLTAKDAYLLQNAPNPYQTTTEIQYYVPRGLNNVQIEIRDVTGVLIQTFDINQPGFGKLEVNGNRLASGSYLYFLSIDGEAIDSKVMILNK
ncbi:MAG: T9SS type A sorting domain-containing protein [Saprospiraceae bacterium]|nr:T9SS type A sorting domain-containing protein [Saprospiraceae bacterium]